MPTGCAPPVYEGNLFSESALRDLFEHYRKVSDPAPLVRLSKLGVYAVGRIKDDQQALGSRAA